MRLRFFSFLFLLLLSAAAAPGASPHKEVESFSTTWDVGSGNSVFVTGNHPDLGNWDATRAVKLHWTTGNVWRGEIAIQAGAQLQYRFIGRSTAHDQWCVSSNSFGASDLLTRSVSAQPPAPYSGKTIYYLSGWNQAHFVYTTGGNVWNSAAMQRVGAGRTAGESLYKLTGLTSPANELEFVFTNGANSWDNPPGGGNYRTPLDVFQVQDGGVYSYQPPATVSAPQVTSHFVNSTATGIPGRTVRVYVPRGYQQNTWKRYPVLYLHDGQNVFQPGGEFGTWNAEGIATTEIGHGRMREAILVAVNHGGSARIPEYQPPGDSYQGTQGRANAYAEFLIHNVRPFVDTNFRTLTSRPNTLTLGSSMGGLVSLYLGREFDTFGKIGVVSPALWIAPNYVNTVAAGAKKPLRVYLDMGTNEGNNPANPWADAQQMYNIHLAQGYAVNGDFWFVAGCGAAHNEAAWQSRLPGMYRYLLPVREEPAALAQRDYPPGVRHIALDLTTRNASLTFPTFYGFRYTLLRSADFTQWEPVTTTSPEPLPWSSAVLADENFPAGQRMFWRVEAAAAP